MEMKLIFFVFLSYQYTNHYQTTIKPLLLTMDCRNIVKALESKAFRFSVTSQKEVVENFQRFLEGALEEYKLSAKETGRPFVLFLEFTNINNSSPESIACFEIKNLPRNAFVILSYNHKVVYQFPFWVRFIFYKCPQIEGLFVINDPSQECIGLFESPAEEMLIRNLYFPSNDFETRNVRYNVFSECFIIEDI
jgi:hypothetical protein